jgi:hypothetical protein
MRRAVGRWQLYGLSINDVIGSGIYLLPAAAARLPRFPATRKRQCRVAEERCR